MRASLDLTRRLSSVPVVPARARPDFSADSPAMLREDGVPYCCYCGKFGNDREQRTELLDLSIFQVDAMLTFNPPRFIQREKFLAYDNFHREEKREIISDSCRLPR